LSLGSIGFGFVAGVLSMLSPCVLPILPLVLGPALAAHRLGIVALALGLVASFVAVGLFVATVGFSIGLDGDAFRQAAAILLALFGVVLLSGSLQQRFSVVTGGVASLGQRLMTRISPAGLNGQFLLGLLLGAAWSPCVGPTLGAASVLAAQGKDLAHVALVMAAFGVGGAVPLLLIGTLSQEAVRRWRARIAHAGRVGKLLLGAAALAVALMILTGADRALETALVAASPAWLTDLTTRF
jgi:cytochrome c-type biogenesis protein